MTVTDIASSNVKVNHPGDLGAMSIYIGQILSANLTIIRSLFSS